MNITVLVDFENDSVRTALEVARRARRRGSGAFGSTRRSRSSTARCGTEMGDFRPTGVNPRLVRNVRDALDDAGFGDVQDRRLGRVHRREDPRVRGGRRAGRRLRRRLVADPRLERLHRATSSSPTGSRRPRSAGTYGRARGWSSVDVKRILWDVDTQVDFVRADGKLAVPGRRGGAAGDGATRCGGARGAGSRTSPQPTTTS